ncbi:LLM class F420-dependent oxidoreductase [Planotetraspora sp. A-T 1434]|uniref:LLM class F420-dependent oxidoreductase n=1 Tax=Planotetraspora sp. A-T 1434 TaxID=2979219 RepID=UPI0021BF45B6|nr:LLM class F420-dependent oxidoreductase [Planotetraspora sp. A-T 1434]MCT9929505.1 LLM class F420-dependent oxidoreductase [Planotetraspora sp. A-T 1434]
MKLRIFTEPQQGSTYDDLLAVAQATERLGFDAFFRSDHYMRIGAGDPGPGANDAWVTLAGLARETSRIRLGTLVTPATFRLPGPLAISVAGVDQMSGGRVELGLGAGWFDDEHLAYGIPFPPVGERFERLEEQLEIVTGLWAATKPFSFEGRHYRLVDSPALPKPVQRPRPPIIMGGTGAKRTPRLVARFADEYNVPFRGLEDTGVAYDRVREACEEAGRGSILLSAAQTVCVGRDDAEVARRAEAIGEDIARLRAGGLVGTPEEIVDKIGKFAELGAERIYLQVLDLADLDHLELIAAEVLPHV